MTWLIVALCVYLTIAVGAARTLMPYRYRALRTPRNGSQMPEDDARREAMRLSWQDGFLWPAYAVTGALLVPLVVVFDGVPWAARQTGKAVAAAAPALAPAIAPVRNWATRPLALEVQRDQALALAARADEPVADEPLVPDEIATWEPPIRTRVHSPRTGEVYEIESGTYLTDVLADKGWVIEHDYAKRNARKGEA